MLLNMLNVGVVEAGRVFEAEAEHTVEADVTDPDDGERKQNRFRFEQGDRQERRWSEIGVDDVVADGSDAGSGEIAEHEKIRCEKE